MVCPCLPCLAHCLPPPRVHVKALPRQTSVSIFPWPWGLRSLEGQVKTGHVWSGVWFLSDTDARCWGNGCTAVCRVLCKSWCSAEMFQEVWQTLALIIYFCACMRAEEGFPHPSQLHKTHARKQTVQLPLSLRMRAWVRWQRVTRPHGGWRGASRSGDLPPSSLAEQLCLSPHPRPLPTPASHSCSCPGCLWLTANVGESRTQDPKCQESMMKWGEPHLWSPKAWGQIWSLTGNVPVTLGKVSNCPASESSSVKDLT